MYLYSKWVRLWHFVNALLIIILIISGMSMQFTGSDAPSLTGGFAGAVRWHNITAIVLIISYIGFVAGNIITGNGKYYRICKKDINTGIGRQMKYFIHGMFKNEDQPFPVTLENKFYPLQKVIYVLTMYLVLPLLIISGSVLMIPDMTIIRIFGPGMFIVMDIIHIILGLLISLFLIIHIYLCTIGPKPGSLFRGIITGFYGGDE